MLNEYRIVSDYQNSVVAKMQNDVAGSSDRPGMTKEEAEKAIPIIL